jgi:hypothetical protein
MGINQTGSVPAGPGEGFPQGAIIGGVGDDPHRRARAIRLTARALISGADSSGGNGNLSRFGRLYARAAARWLGSRQWPTPRRRLVGRLLEGSPLPLGPAASRTGGARRGPHRVSGKNDH